jgi:phosphatidylglycerol:prolipoprotein diacylglycerol transferase
MFLVLWRLGARKLKPGQLFAMFMILYAVERFIIEFVRAKTDRWVFGLSTSQLASIALLGVGAYLWFRQGRAVEAAPAVTSKAARSS